jgi:hypothetical protein
MTKKQDKTVKDKGVGFLKAAQKAHIAVCDIPLDFFADLGMFEKQVKSAKDFNRRFINSMYNRLEGMAEAPGKFYGAIGAKLRGTTKAAAPAKEAKPKAVVRPEKAKAPAKAKAAQPKARATRAKPKTAASRVKKSGSAARAKATKPTVKAAAA